MRKIDCAHRKILKIFSGGQKMEKIASKLGVISFNPNCESNKNSIQRADRLLHAIR